MNIMEILGQLDEAKAGLERVSKDFSPKLVTDGLVSHAVKFVLETVLRAGPPEELASKLQMNAEQTNIFYGLIVTAALKRNGGS